MECSGIQGVNDDELGLSGKGRSRVRAFLKCFDNPMWSREIRRLNAQEHDHMLGMELHRLNVR
jgi:hypothetical protein